MKGLIIKDLLNLRKYFKTLLLFLLFYGFLSYRNGDSTLLIMMVAFFINVMVITSMTEDESAQWDRLALAMPISRKIMVKSKYLLSILLLLTGIIPATGLAYIIMNMKGTLNISKLGITSYGAFAIALIFVAVSIPLIYKYGVEKTRLLVFIIVAIPVAVGFIIEALGIPLPNKEQIMILLKVSPILLGLFVLVSSKISYGIYRKKDI